MQPENFSLKDSLALIDQMINQARNRVTENGFLYLLGGWIILFCSVGHFAMIRFTSIRNPEIIWAAARVAVILQIIYMVRNKKRRRLKPTAIPSSIISDQFRYLHVHREYRHEPGAWMAPSLPDVPDAVWHS